MPDSPPFLTLPPSQVTLNLLSVSVNLPTLGTSYKWKQSVCPFVSGVFQEHNVFTGYPCYSVGQYLLPF
jgi:hypothetical protein